MEDKLKKINFVKSGYLILDSQQLYGENFLMDSRFRNKNKNFIPEPVLPEELSSPLAPGEIACIQFDEYTEYDDFWRKVVRHDFMAIHLEGLMREADLYNIGRKKVNTSNLQFYQGYENGEPPGERYCKRYAGSLHLTLEKDDKGFNLYIPHFFN
jgi:hypothetical protein